MHRNDKLDAQLSARLTDNPGAIQTLPANSAETLAQLMAADVLAQWRAATPRADYANALEARMLAHAAVIARDVLRMPSPTPHGLAAARGASEPFMEPGRTSHKRGSRSRGLAQQAGRRSRGIGSLRPLWSLAAAALLLMIGAGVVLAAAGAGPGSPLYGLHRLEQNARVSIASSSSERVRLRLAYAQADLSAIDTALARHAAGATYTDALGAFQSDLQAIRADLPGLPAGAERDRLAAQFTALETQGRSDLFHGLPTLPWSDRVKTTTVLGSFGVPTPTVTTATMTRTLTPRERVIRIVVVGSNFQPGAVVIVNGEAVGTVLSQTSTQLVVQLDPTYPVTSAKTIGVSNPDGTAAETRDIASALDAGNGKGSAGPGAATPGTLATATTGNGNGNCDGNAGGHPGGGAHGTPTPSR